MQGLEQESGRIRVQVQSEVVHVWPGELVRTQEQEEQSGGSNGSGVLWRSRTRLRHEPRMKSNGRDIEEGVRGLEDGGRPRSADVVLTSTDSVTSEDTRNQRGLGDVGSWLALRAV